MPENEKVGETTQTISDADAQADAEADAFLANLDAGDDSSSSREESPASNAPKGQTRDGNGRFVGKTEDTDEDMVDTDDQDTSEPDEDAAPRSDTVNPDEYRKAVNALQRVNTPQSVLDSMDPTDVVAWGSEVAKQQAETDGFGQKLAELQKAKATAPADMPFGVDLTEAVKPFAEYFGDDVAEPLQAFGKALLSQVETKFSPLEKELKTQAQDAARTRLSDKYGLDRDDRWQKVLDRRTQDTNVYANEIDALNAAARHEFADEIIANYEKKVKAQHAKRANGQSTTESKTGHSENLPADAEDRLLNAIQDGDERAIKKYQTRTPKQGMHELLGSGGKLIG
jgi:hypothetical protein